MAATPTPAAAAGPATPTPATAETSAPPSSSIFDQETITLRPASDFHVHLRDGEMMRLVTPTIRSGGVDTVYVMPNLVPPITTVKHALSYKAELQALAPDVTFLMTLYLSPSITPAVIAEAAAAGISGVKVYPAGVTTNSSAGVVSLEPFYPVFEAMQTHNLVLNLHGEVPSTSPQSSPAAYSEPDAATVLTAEPLFLPTLATLHANFPRLRIVLEHCTTAAAVAAVRACGNTVRGTITAHHLFLTTDDVVADSLNFCKPVAKSPADRVALLRAALDDDPRDKFFFGSDSAPHPAERKRPGWTEEDAGVAVSAGCFTAMHAVQLVVEAAEEAVRRGWVLAGQVDEARLDRFLSVRGRKFYGLAEGGSGSGSESGEEAKKLVLERKKGKIEMLLKSEAGGISVVPFRRGEEVRSLKWV